MVQTNVNIRMEKDLKEQFEQFCKATGLTMSVAFNIFAKAVVKQQRIPFEISVDPFYDTDNIQRLKESISDLEKGKTVVKTIEELEEMENE